MASCRPAQRPPSPSGQLGTADDGRTEPIPGVRQIASTAAVIRKRKAADPADTLAGRTTRRLPTTAVAVRETRQPQIAAPRLAGAETDHHGELGDVLVPPSSGQSGWRLRYKDFISVEQDRPCVCVAHGGPAAGLFSLGFDCCFAIVLQSGDAMGLMHTSQSAHLLDAPIRHALDRFKAVSALPPRVTLGVNAGNVWRGLLAGEAWEDYHDCEQANADRKAYATENFARMRQDLQTTARRFGAAVVNLRHGVVSVDRTGTVRATEPDSCVFLPRRAAGTAQSLSAGGEGAPL